MRVLIVTEVYRPGVGGVQEAIDTLVQGLTAMGDEVVILTGSPRGITRSHQEHLANGALVHRLPSIPSPSNPKNNRISIAPPLFIKRFWVSQAPFDVIHMHTPASWLHSMIARLARKHSIPYITTNHVMAQNLTMNKTGVVGQLVMKLYERQAQPLLDKSAAVTAPTHAALAAMRGVTVPTYAISNGLDTTYYSPGSIDGDVASKFQIDLQATRLIYTGRLDGEKRVDILIDAMPQVLAKHPNTQLIIVGKGLLDKELRQRAAQHNVGNRIVFCGYVSNDEKRALLRMSDIFVNASPAELQCISALEALACGVPLVVADQVALPELTDDKNNGRTFAYPDTHDLAHALDELIANPDLRNDMTAAGREWVQQYHDFSNTVAQYRDTYQAAQRNA